MRASWPNAYVFAGGALDPQDESVEARDLCEGLDDKAASERLQLPSNGLGFMWLRSARHSRNAVCCWLTTRTANWST